MQRSLAELKAEAKVRGVSASEGWKRKDYVKAFQRQELAKLEHIPWGMQKATEIDEPMLCFCEWNLSDDEKSLLWNSSDWVLEEKYDGVRMIIMYHPDEGFSFYSRNLSVANFLPVNYTEKILMDNHPNFEGYSTGSEWKDVYKKPFILDSEVISNSKNVSTVLGNRGVITETALQAIAALLALNSEQTLKIQEQEKDLIEFRIFDILYFNEDWVMSYPFNKRRELLEKLSGPLFNKGFNGTISRIIRRDKKEFYKRMLSSGREGCVAKNINSEYVPTKRWRTHWVKIKRTMSQVMDTIEGWVSGFELGKEGKGWEDLVGALHISVSLEKEDGTAEDHVIARVTNIPLELRKKITIREKGEYKLHPEMYGKVAEVDGQSVSARKMSLTHPKLVRFRIDKNKHQCTLKEADLKRNMI